MPIHYRILWSCLVMACVAIVLGLSFVAWAATTIAEERETRIVGGLVLAAIVATGIAVIAGLS
jgi:hypothetical protein